MLKKFNTAIDKLSKLPGKTACTFGFHDLEWNYVASETCNQLGKCKRPNCRGTREQIVHIFSAWNYVIDDKCLQKRECIRCHTTGEQTTHTWGDEQYEKEGSCQKISICTRCNEVQMENVDHIWGGWQYEKEGSCQQISICKRCDEIQFGEIEHVRGVWQYESETSCHQVSYCLRCYNRDHHEDEANHRWSIPYKDNQTMRWKQKCERCGIEELGDVFPPDKPRVVVYKGAIVNNPHAKETMNFIEINNTSRRKENKKRKHDNSVRRKNNEN
jgi:hypothetical protein